MQEMVGIQALGADLLLALQTEQNEVLHMLLALLNLGFHVVGIVLLVLDEACQVLLEVLLIV